MTNGTRSGLSLATFALLAASLSAHAQAPATPTPPPPSTLPDLPTTAPATPTSQLPDAPGAGAPAAPAIDPTGPMVLLDTTAGRLSCKLFDKQAPLASNNFIGLATGSKDWTDPNTGQKVHGRPFYNGTSFHRVIPGFMIQGGDRKGDGTGDAGYYFDNEVTPGLDFDVAGRLAMANAGANTNGTQFFITEVPYPDLDGKYTIFGQCDPDSVELVKHIARGERDSSDKPLITITLNKVSVVRPGEPTPPAPAIAAPTAAPAIPVPVMPSAPK